jgi:DNA-binding transcriptional LysR family regulator
MSMPIPVDHLRRTDLSLLVYFVVLVEEKTVSRAAARLDLTQTALTRALKKLREVFHDELVVRGELGYQTTPRGQDLLTALATLLPQMDDIIAGKHFDPATANTTFRITAADSLCHLYAPIVARKYQETPNMSFVFSTYGEDRYSDLEANAQDLVLDAQYKTLRTGLRTATLFEEEFVCAVARNSSHGRKLSLDKYLAAKHVAIGTLHGTQAIPDLEFARTGLKRECPFRVPYFSVGLAMVATSELIVTLPMSLAAMLINPETTRLVKPPKEVEGYRYVMVWHRRQETDPRHTWLRQSVQRATVDLVQLLAEKKKAFSLLARPAWNDTGVRSPKRANNR